MPKLRALLCLGRVSHDSVVKALGARAKDAPFAHGAVHRLPRLTLYDSYHCSRYNTNTGVLTAQMFFQVFEDIAKDLSGDVVAFPTFLDITFQVRTALKDPRLSIDRLARLVEIEPLMSTKVVRMGDTLK